MSAIRDLLLSKKVIVCCGSGGVGKTTTSAALAIGAALEGKKVIVVTIDPARRLATSLGLKSLGNEPTDITPIVGTEAKGTIHAIMPDNGKTFENFLKSVSGNNSSALQKILKTSIYKIFAREFSGTNEYLAMEKLYELYSCGKYDLVVLDTPPSTNTLSFLDAPNRLAEFFDDKIVKWFIEPSSKMIAKGVSIIVELLEKLTGKGFIGELVDFMTGFFELKDGFLDKLKKVNALLKQDDLAFVMVTSPERLQKEDTRGFVDHLRKEGYPFWGFIINRSVAKTLNITLDGFVPPAALGEVFMNEFSIDLKRSKIEMSEADLAALKKNFDSLVPLLDHEYSASKYLKSIEGTESFFIAEQPFDVHNVEGLLLIAKEIIDVPKSAINLDFLKL